MKRGRGKRGEGRVATGAGERTAERVLLLLKMRGPKTAAELGVILEMTDEAARQHLVRLGAEGLVESTSEARGVGRPRQVWRLTEAGHNRFPDAHADLTVQLISTIRSVLGEEALERLIAAREAQALASYREGMAGAADLEERLERLRMMRDREGYMCELERDAEGYLLIENHCPICAAASACQGFCQAELRTFRRVLGREAEIRREEHLISGSRRCAYRITEAKRRTAERGSRKQAGRQGKSRQSRQEKTHQR